jgi:hypothetical protein
MTATTSSACGGIFFLLVLLVAPAQLLAQEPILQVRNPCHAPRLPGLQMPDFVFGQHVAAGTPSVSPDGLVRILMRGIPTNPLARRLNITVTVFNQGGRDYRATERCTAKVRVTINEGPDHYVNSSLGATHFEEEDAPPLLQPNTGGRLVTFVPALRGTGPDAPGNWNEDYEYVLLDFALDPGNTILESSETNNAIGPYCYHAPTGVFASLKACSGGR